MEGRQVDAPMQPLASMGPPQRRSVGPQTGAGRTGHGIGSAKAEATRREGRSRFIIVLLCLLLSNNSEEGPSFILDF